MKASLIRKLHERITARKRESKALTSDLQDSSYYKTTTPFLLSDGYPAEVNELSSTLLPLEIAAMVLTYTVLLFDALGEGREFNFV